MKIKILRQAYPGAEPYWQTFAYDGPADASVASVLDWLNYRDDITDIDGNPAPRISWECSCLQAMCGSCAMVINDRPALACETFLRDLIKTSSGTPAGSGESADSVYPADAVVTIRPLSKFPVISDLVVDRGIIQDSLLAANDYIGEYSPSDPAEADHQYIAAKCLKCGLCLEVCPNYGRGLTFYGAAFANDCYLVATRGDLFDDAILSEYSRHFAAGCSKSFACMDVCPMQIPTLSSMAKLNRGKVKNRK